MKKQLLITLMILLAVAVGGGWAVAQDYCPADPPMPPTLTPRPTYTALPTYTPNPTYTPDATDTPTPTPTCLPTSTPIIWPTATEYPIQTPYPTSTPYPTATPTGPTATPTDTATPTPTPGEGIFYYVAPDGSDSNPGTIDQPWRTVAQASYVSEPGATVYFREGIYNGMLYPHASGAEGAYITFASYPGETAHIVNNSGDGVAIRTIGIGGMGYDQMRSYIEIRDLEITGGDKGIRVDQAHHLRLLNNDIHDSGSAGISVPNGADHLLIEGNRIHGNCNSTSPCSSGISIWNSGCFWGETNTCKILDDGAPGYHVIVRKNIIYANRNDDSGCGVTDGNGLIMDNNGAANPLTLVENNLIMHNGGRCLQVLNTSHVHFLNNTCVENVQTPHLISNGSGELQITEMEIGGASMDTTDVSWINTLVYGHGAAALTRQWFNIHEYEADYNLLYNGTGYGGFNNGPNTIYDQDPLLTSPLVCASKYDCDWDSLDAHLLAGSPAIDAGMVGSEDDFDGISRPQGAGYDIGAYEQ